LDLNNIDTVDSSTHVVYVELI